MNLLDKDNTTRNIIIAFFVIVVFLWLAGSGACSSSSSRGTAAVSDTPTTKSASSEEVFANSNENPSRQSKSYYEDPLWPTRDSYFLSIPESNRYYMAYHYIGQHHTVVGPVSSVYQATQSQGMPIFVNIGAEGFIHDRVTFVIWAEDLDADLERMLNAVDHGGAWLEVTGEVYLYNNQIQIQTGHGYFEYSWWTNVD